MHHMVLIAFFSLWLGIVTSEQMEYGPVVVDSPCRQLYATCDALFGDLHCERYENFATLMKRSSKYDEKGPFWANRGKKIPLYTHTWRYAEEPQWKSVGITDDQSFQAPPSTRAKKEQQEAKDSNRDRRTQDNMYIDATSPFFATRGKKDSGER